MTKKKVVLLAGAAFLLLAGLLVAAMKYMLSEKPAKWTTRSQAALEEFESGCDATKRGYRDRAIAHFDRALELDPKFVVAKIYLSQMYPSSSAERKELYRAIEKVDFGRLNPRERFLTRYYLADSDGKRADAEAILQEFLEVYPHDFLGLEFRCQEAWKEQDWELAEDCYYKMVELHPNRVEAYNRLGFIDMAQGRFTEAEEHFRTYRFIAPDQVAPHSSLAELLVLLGRYDEAEEILFEALEIQGDDCRAHYQLLRTYYFSGRLDEATAVIDRMESFETCARRSEQGFFCHLRGLVAFFRGDFELAWSFYSENCLEARRGFDLIGHLVALASGRTDEAEGMQERLAELIREFKTRRAPVDLAWFESLDAHFEGLQEMAKGRYGNASEHLRQADERLPYWMHERSGFKLLNRLFLARSFALEGKTSEAQAMLRKVEAVNPSFPGHLPEIRFMEAARP